MPPLTAPTAWAARWRSLLEDPDAAAHVFPSLAGAMRRPLERRRILKLMAASLALAGCDNGPPGATGDTRWVPAVIAPPGIVPGLANRYSTAATAGGTAIGLVVDHKMGRPVKVEGNPLHPASLGATDAISQALILDFYDPDRASGLLRRGEPASGNDLLAALLPVRARLFANRGAGLRILTAPVVSPTLGRQIDALLQMLPEARWHQHDPLANDNALRGAVLAFGRPLDVLPRLAEADVVVGLESDLVSGAPGWVRHARDIAARRNPTGGPPNRIYAAESVPTLLGAIADHRSSAAPAELRAAVLALRAGVTGGGTVDAPPWVAAALADLRAANGRALVHAGPDLPPAVRQDLVAMHQALDEKAGMGRAFTITNHFPIRAEAFDVERELPQGCAIVVGQTAHGLKLADQAVVR